jgi:hypothetical protein
LDASAQLALWAVLWLLEGKILVLIIDVATDLVVCRRARAATLLLGWDPSALSASVAIEVVLKYVKRLVVSVVVLALVVVPHNIGGYGNGTADDKSEAKSVLHDESLELEIGYGKGELVESEVNVKLLLNAGMMC